MLENRERICIGGYGLRASKLPKSRISVYVPVGNLPPVVRLRRAYSFTRLNTPKEDAYKLEVLAPAKNNTRRSRFAARSPYQRRYMSALEILAPAGSKEALFAAISYGADAVYLGLNNFNARKKAENFTLENLGHYIKYAHSKNVKVYLTLNTLVKDIEFKDLENVIKSAVSLGIDAFIVQDLGVFYIIKTLYPDFAVHASTQMGICNLEGAKFCEKIGIKRVILARETNFEELERITRNCKIETEVFVHGALCVSMSGQCFLSSSIFNKSGNRGECLQPCRKFYKVFKDSKNISSAYMLSPSDLCLANYIKKLKEINITSIKIEGRMRRSEYVAESVRLYKSLASGEKSIDLNPIKKLYNRGDYTSGYMFLDNINSLMSKKVQGHKGLYIGRVLEVKNDILIIEATQNLIKGDGFKIFNKDGLETGSAIYNEFIKDNLYSLLFKGKVSINDKVHITTDVKQIEKINENIKMVEFNKELNTVYIEPHKINLKFTKTTVKRINIAMVDSFKVNTKIFDYIVFKPKDYIIENINKFIEIYSEYKNKFLYLPPFLSKEDINLLEKISKDFEGFYINNPGQLEIDFVKNKKIIIGEGFNIFNRYAIKFISQFNPLAIVLSKELNTKALNDIAEVSDIPVSALVYGETESMQLKHCVIKNVYGNDCKDCKYSGQIIYEDEKFERFKVIKRKLNDCYFILLNSKKLNGFKNLNIEKFGYVFDFSFDNKTEAEKAQTFYYEKFIKKDNPDFNFNNFTNGSLIKGV